MSEELIPPFTGPMSKETAQYRAKQAVEYYHKQLKSQNKPELPKRLNRDRENNITDHQENVNGYRGQYETKHLNSDGRHSAQVQYNLPPEQFVRGGQRATVHGTNSGRSWLQNKNNNTQNLSENTRRNVSQEHRSGSKKRYSRGLHRSNSNLEESLEYINVENLDTSMSSRREYGSASSLVDMNASTSSDSFFQMLETLRPATIIDQRSPAPVKLKEVLRGSKIEEPNQQTFLRNLEKIANGSVINNRPLSDEVDEGSQSPRTKAKFKQKDRKLRSKSITPDVGPGVWKRFRGKNDPDIGAKTGDSVPEVELKGDDRFRRKAFVHYDSQSIGFEANQVLNSKGSTTNFTNISTGASAASGVRESYAGEADDPEIATDDGDGKNNELVQSCSFFRNEIGGEEVRIVGLTATKQVQDHTRDRTPNKSAILINRSPECCGVTVLDCSPTSVGHILPPHIKHKGHVIEYMDYGAFYYRHFFNGQEHQNYFGIDDNLGPIAVSIRREKLEERENHLGKCESGLYQYRVILRTSELTTLRGAVLEDAIPASGRLSSSRGVPVKDILEFLVPEVQATCLRQATAGHKTCDQLLKVDEQRIFSTYKVGIIYCKPGQTTEEDMYNNEHASPAFEEFLQCIGEKVRLKGFEKYRAQLDNKTDSTGTHSVYTTFNNSEIMFHVSTMLPYTPKNHQQLLRKRHIGNDIVTIVFQEPGSAPFTPKSVRSQFQHVFIIVRAHNPCSDKTSYSIAVSRSKDVPPFGPTIPEKAKFYKSRDFAEFLLAKVVNGENAAHHSEKFSAMAIRTRQEYLKDLATNYVTSNSLESASKLSKFVSGKKKEKNRGKLVPDNFALGAIVWHVQVEDGGKSPVRCYLGIAAETLVIVEAASRDVIFTTHCGSVIGWTSQALSLRLYYQQGECLVLEPSSGDMEELQEIVSRLKAVTMGCENGTRVPVIIPPEAVAAMAYLANPVIRKNSGIKENNPYLFANSGLDVLRAASSLEETRRECGLKFPDRVHDTNLRKHCATIAQTEELTLKRNGLGQLGFHIQAEGIVTDVEPHGFAYEAELRRGSRLVEICKVATVTLNHDQMVDLLRTSATVKVVVIPPLKDGGPRGVVNLNANHHYSSFPALNAVIQAEYSHHQRQARSSSSSSEPMLSPVSPTSLKELPVRDLVPPVVLPRVGKGASPLVKAHMEELEERVTQPRHRRDPADLTRQVSRDSRESQDSSLQNNSREVTPRELEERWELREIIRKDNSLSKEGNDSSQQEDLVFIHERDSSISSTHSYASHRSSNTLPHQKKSSSSSDNRGEMKSPPNRTFYLTDSTWSSSSLPRSTSNHIQTTSYHGYQDSTVSSGRGSLFEGREIVDHYGSSSRGLDDSSYGTLEDRHKHNGSKDSLDQTSLGGSRDWSEISQPRRPPPPKDVSPWAESTALSQTTYLTSSTENIYTSSTASSSSTAASRKQTTPAVDYSSVQHGNYAQELLKQSQNTKYLLSHGHDSSRKEGITSANSSSVNLSDTSFSSGGSGQTASNMPQPGSQADLNMYSRDRSREDASGRRRANTTSAKSGVARRAELTVSPLSSEQSSPRSSSKNLSGMSSEESLSTRLRPGVTTKLTKARATNNLEDDLMRLIDPDLAESDLHGILASRSSNRRLSGRLVRTMSDESLHSGKGSLLFDYDNRESLFTEKKHTLQGSREQLRQHRLSPRALGDSAPRVPMPDSTASLDWSSLVDVATKAIEGTDDPKDRIASPAISTVSSSSSSVNKSREIPVKVESLYRQKSHDRPPDPPTGSNPPVWRSVVANPQLRIQELEAKVTQLEEELAQERQESAALDSEVQRLRTENARLQEESQNAAAQLRRFTEWFFTTIDRQ